MDRLVPVILPELILIAVACVLFLIGVSSKVAARRLAPLISLAALGVVFAWQIWAVTDLSNEVHRDPWNTLAVSAFANYVKLLTAGIGLLLVLLAWPTNADATGSASMNFAGDAGEFFALMLLSISGVFLVAGAND